MVNEQFRPTAECEAVLEIFKDGRETRGPWGRANPRYIIDKTDLDKQTVEYQLRRLRDAGWIQNVARGLYEFVEDPREN
jgi:DNA-binding MarR family transcriptional regulator